MTPEDVIKQICKGWPNSVYATEQFWHVQYVKQLEVHTGPALAAGFQRVLENLQKLTKGTPPKPDVIAAQCRELNQNKPQAYKSRDPIPPPRSPIMTDAQLNNHCRVLKEIEARIARGDGLLTDPGLVKMGNHFIEQHQRAMEKQRG